MPPYPLVLHAYAYIPFGHPCNPPSGNSRVWAWAGFVVAQYKELSTDAQFSLLHKDWQPRNKTEVAILHFIDIATFNCELCKFIGHLIIILNEKGNKKLKSN